MLLTIKNSLRRAVALGGLAPVVGPYHITPPQLASLVAFYEADDLALGTLTTWADSTAFGNDVTQGTEAAKPTVVTALDGRKGVQFSSAPTGDVLALLTPDFDTPTGLTLHAVVNKTSVGGGSVFLSAKKGTPLSYIGTNGSGVATGVGSAHVATGSEAAGAYENTYRQYTVTFNVDTDEVILYVDGAAQDINLAATSALSLNHISIGGADDTAPGFTGVVMEALVYKIALGVDDVDALAAQHRLKFPSLP